MITFNYHILKSLGKLLGESDTSISNKSGVGRTTVGRIQAKGDCRVPVLVDICNAYHLNISVFFSDATEVGTVNSLFVSDERWSPVEYHPENMPGNNGFPDSVKCSALAFLVNSNGYSFDKILVQDLSEHRAATEGRQEVDDSQSPWTYVSHLFRMLPSVFKCVNDDIGLRAGRAAMTYRLAVKRGDIRVRTLLDICNTFSIPIELFFQRECSAMIPESVVRDGYSSQRFYPYRISDLYGKETDYTYERFKQELEYTNPRMIRMMSKDTPMTACELVRLCNTIGISPSWFFKDNEDHMQEVRERSAAATIRNLENKIARSDAENRRLESQLRHMEAINDMKKV